MIVKCLEIRDRNTFIPVICLKPIPANEAQAYLLRRDGYRATHEERCVILINAQCRGVSYDPYNWGGVARTIKVAHHHIEQHWDELADGDVVDVEFILGVTTSPKKSERLTVGEL